MKVISDGNNLHKYQVVREIYVLSEKIIKYFSLYLDNLGEDYALDGKARKDMIDMFLKVGALMCKIIALEHKIGNIGLISGGNAEDENDDISEDDIIMMQNYLERYKGRQGLEV